MAIFHLTHRTVGRSTHEGPQPRQIEAKSRSAEKLASIREARNTPGKPEQLHSARERAAERAREAAWHPLSGSPHSQQTPGLRQARGIKPESAFTQPIPPGPPLTTHSGVKPLRGRSANKNYTGGGRQRCDPRSRRLCIFCMP
jgi:hypothetical protein